MLVAAFTLHGGAALAQLLPTGPVLASADMRPAQELSGEWTYSIDPYRDGQAGFHGGQAGTGHRRYDDTDVETARNADPLALYEYDMDRAPRANLPASWLTHAPEMRHYEGLVWYQKRFDTGVGDGERQFLRFGAVNYAAQVWLNGEYLGSHEGGFTPFAFEVTGKLRAEGNRLVVGADSIRDWQDVPPPVTDWETYGGITRSVRLIEVPQTYVDDAWVRLGDDGQIKLDIALDGPRSAGAAITLSIQELGIEQSFTADDEGRLQLSLAAPEGLELWSPENPKLYRVVVEAGGDIWADRVGFRTIETRGSEVLLNGERVFLSGISIHEEELGDNPARTITPDAARDLLAVVRNDLNGNFVRLAHYPHGEEMTRAADEMGLLVWSEIPVYWRIAFANEDTLGHARTMLSEMVLRDRNRASVIIWSVGNETPIDGPRNDFMLRLVEDTRLLDPHRLVSAALLTERDDSGERPIMRLVDPLADHLDVLAVNTYNGWYGPDRPDEVPRIGWDVPADRPLFFSELGAGAQPGLFAAEGEEPIKFTEDYQADYYRYTLEMAEGIDTLVGLSPWILKDFRSPRRQLPDVQDGWNRKGIIGPNGEKKLAFDVLSGWYAKQAGKNP